MTQKNPRILVIDDDPDLHELLGRYLSAQGFDVTGVEDGAGMDRFLSTHSTDLIILDLMLPGEDGLSIAKRLRSVRDTPIIMLSARGEEVDRIVGLEVGADDYLPKPFNPRELLARIRAVLRRPTVSLQSETDDSQQQHRPQRGRPLRATGTNLVGSGWPLLATTPAKRIALDLSA